MQDPLTKKQHKDFLSGFRADYERKYKELLKKCTDMQEESGNSIGTLVIDGTPISDGSHVLARIALMEAAKGFRIVGFKALQKELVR